MIVPQIVTAGDPLLKKIAISVTEFSSKELEEIISTMFEAMHHYNGVGIAAPQIGISKRIVVYGVNANLRYPDVAPIADTVLINPMIKSFSSEKAAYYEGCLSLPNIRGEVIRAVKILLSANTVTGEIVERQVDGFEARIIQHEVDHLNGILFPSRMQDLSTLIYTNNA